MCPSQRLSWWLSLLGKLDQDCNINHHHTVNCMVEDWHGGMITAWWRTGMISMVEDWDGGMITVWWRIGMVA